MLLQALFNPGGLAIPDSYLINVPLTDPDVASLFRQLLELGLVNIYTRNGGNNFDAVYGSMRGLGQTDREIANDIFQRLRPYSSKATWIGWPSGEAMGASFGKLLRQNFLSNNKKHPVFDDVPESLNFKLYITKFVDAIKEAEEIRIYDCEKRGIEYIGDIRANEVVFSLTKRRFGSGVNNYHDARKLIEKHAVNTSERAAFLHFLTIISGAYERNWGRRAGIAVDRAGRHEWMDNFCRLPDTSSSKIVIERPLAHSVRLPSAKNLLNLNLSKIEELIQDRRDYKIAYQQLINLSEGAEVEESFRHFADQIDIFAGKICEASESYDLNQNWIIRISERKWKSDEMFPPAKWLRRVSPIAPVFTEAMISGEIGFASIIVSLALGTANIIVEVLSATQSMDFVFGLDGEIVRKN